LVEMAENIQRVETTTAKSDTEQEAADIGSKSLGVIVVWKETTMEKTGSEPKGADGVSGGTRMANEGVALSGYPETTCARRGVVEVNRGSVVENVENQSSGGVVTHFDG
jgi:hypothetical protein